MRLTHFGWGFFLFKNMPYEIVEDHPDCPSTDPWGVVKEDDGKLMGCHESKAKAQKQISAIYASESASGLEADFNRSEPMSEQQVYYTRALVDLGEVGQRQATAKDLLENPLLPVPFIASTAGVKADGINLKMEDWDLSRYKTYGPVMWVHNYWHPPLGTGTAELGKKLRINVQFDRDDEFAMLIRGKAIKGMMAGSVGWWTTEDKKNELLEFSMTPMGLDPDALPDIKRMSPTALRTISEALSEDDTGLKEAIDELREEIMGDMKQLITDWLAHDQEMGRGEGEEEECDPETDPDCDPDEDTEGRSEEEEEGRSLIVGTDTAQEEDYMFYNGRIYIPSIIEDGSITWAETTGTSSITDSASSITWYDVTDANSRETPEEILQRAGAVLSKKNRDDLARALELIEGVIARATPDDEFFASLDEERNEDIDDDREEEPGARQEPTPEIVNQIIKVLEEV